MNNSYKDLWNKTYDKLYNEYLSEGFSSNEADRRALLLVDEETLNNLRDRADLNKKTSRGE